MKDPNWQEYVMTEEMFEKEIAAAKKEASLFVAYRRTDGQPLKIIASPGTKVVCEGENLSDHLIAILKRLEESGEKIVETECETSFYVHGSPGCRIKKTASGEYKVVCS
jgi:arginine/lysine/ornithine decarboxylase